MNIAREMQELIFSFDEHSLEVTLKQRTGTLMNGIKILRVRIGDICSKRLDALFFFLFEQKMKMV